MADILYVEDNPVNAKLFAAIVQRDGTHTLHIAADGKQSLAMIESISPALVFLDLHLPDMDGFALLDRMRGSLTGETPCYLVSAEEQSLMGNRAMAAGFTGYIEKPINVQDILGILSRVS